MAHAKTLKPEGMPGNRNPAGDGKNLSIVIIDSGMGGLAICADMLNGLQQRRAVERARITYFNAWPEQNRGYNSLPDDSERLRVFDRALIGMQAFEPDVVYIACNTLSILYPRTTYSRTAAIPVTGIVEFGVDLIHDHLSRQADSQVIILGTLTTIASRSHEKALVKRGIHRRRIVAQACDQLATAIESGPDSPRVRAMIDDFISQAAARLPDPGAPVFAALCCTHYGYARAAFGRSLARHIGSGAVILNPNEAMGAHFRDSFDGPPHAGTAIDLEVVSRIIWSAAKVKAIADALDTVSPVTARALRNYHHDPELFSF